MSPRLENAVPKPKRKKKLSVFDSMVKRARAQKKKPLKKKNSEKFAKRVLRNREYYQSAEWRAKRKAVFERDGFRCVEMIPPVHMGGGYYPDIGFSTRCLTRGEVVNGKQTARGLICEESSYGHRGIPGRIDTCKTRCKDHDRHLTPRERINHSHGFRRVGGEM